MKWDDTYKGAHECYKWYDLLVDDSRLLGYVRHKKGTNEFRACINTTSLANNKLFDNLEDAKAHITAYHVAQKLEGE
jgi:hypothetical protein